MKPLIAIPSPRDLPEVKTVIDSLPADKLWLKYFRPEIDAYKIMQEEFLAKDYTHLVLIPDDLLVSSRHFQYLMQDAEDFPRDIVTGFCNVDTTDFKDFANVTVEEVHALRGNRKYRWFHLDLIWEEVKGVKQIDPLKYAAYPEYMIDVKFAGFAMFSIPRYMLEEIPFRNDSLSGYSLDGCCLDVMFCWDVIQKGYRILCDLRLKENHLKISDYRYDKFMAGVLPPYTFFDYQTETRMIPS
jgi:hypothetical protein